MWFGVRGDIVKQQEPGQPGMGEDNTKFCRYILPAISGIQRYNVNMCVGTGGKVLKKVHARKSWRTMLEAPSTQHLGAVYMQPWLRQLRLSFKTPQV